MQGGGEGFPSLRERGWTRRGFFFLSGLHEMFVIDRASTQAPTADLADHFKSLAAGILTSDAAAELAEAALGGSFEDQALRQFCFVIPCPRF